MHQRVRSAHRSALLCATALAGTVSLVATSAQAANSSASDTNSLATCITSTKNGDTTSF
jgi:hypothetical protein